MEKVEDNFTSKVYSVVAQIPYGRVMTYGQIAALCGNARAARIVGGIAHFGDSDMPWHRVVNRQGGMASGYPGGRSSQQRLLEDEGVVFAEDTIHNLEQVLWQPKL